jgi:cytochrome P450/nitrite reductase/ring-hydroxylating ferredoxin subunit
MSSRCAFDGAQESTSVDLATCATKSSMVRVARSAALSGEGPHSVSAGGVDLVLVRAKAGLRAFEGRCPHKGALLGEGEIEGDKLVCRNHRWQFSIENGRRQGGPQCLVPCAVVERDGDVLVDLSSLPAAADRSRTRIRDIDELPGPEGIPLLGNAHQLDLRRMHLTLEGWADTYGPAYRFRIGLRTVVVVSGSELVEQVLRARPEVYRRASRIEAIFSEMGSRSVVSSEKESWRAQRRLTIQALTNQHLRSFYPTLRIVAERLKRRWDAAADRGCEVDIVSDLKRFTADATTFVAFGHDANTLDGRDDRIQRQLEETTAGFTQRLFALVPTWRFLRLPRDRRLEKAFADLRGWAEVLVEAARARLAADPTGARAPANFLEAMLVARDELGRPFSQDIIFGNLLATLAAGEDTTAHSLSWAVHHMCESPPAVAALRQESDRLLGDAPMPADVDAANKLAWAGAVSNEAMRLRSVSSLLVHEANAATTLGDIRVPARGWVIALTRPAARDAENFVDPHSFRPERWLGGVTGAHEPAASIPFGSGPRICPGRSLGLLEMKLALTTLYKNFEVERVGAPSAVREALSLTIYPVGLKVRLKRRDVRGEARP